MSAQRRPWRLAATAGRGAARLAGEVPNATGCPSAQRAAAENATLPSLSDRWRRAGAASPNVSRSLGVPVTNGAH